MKPSWAYVVEGVLWGFAACYWLLHFTLLRILRKSRDFWRHEAEAEQERRWRQLFGEAEKARAKATIAEAKDRPWLVRN